MTVLEELHTLSGEELEAVVAKVWRVRGWEVEHEGNGDWGVDIRAHKADPIPETEVIQVKYRAPDESLGGPDIQQYTNLAGQEDADKALVVTNTTFTPDAEEIADRTNLKLVDGEALADLILDNGPLTRYEPELELATPAAPAAEPASIADLAEVALDTTLRPEERRNAIITLSSFGEDAVPALARIANNAEGATKDAHNVGEELRSIAREQINGIRQ